MPLLLHFYDFILMDQIGNVTNIQERSHHHENSRCTSPQTHWLKRILHRYYPGSMGNNEMKSKNLSHGMTDSEWIIWYHIISAWVGLIIRTVKSLKAIASTTRQLFRRLFLFNTGVLCTSILAQIASQLSINHSCFTYRSEHFIRF